MYGSLCIMRPLSSFSEFRLPASGSWASRSPPGRFKRPTRSTTDTVDLPKTQPSAIASAVFHLLPLRSASIVDLTRASMKPVQTSSQLLYYSLLFLNSFFDPVSMLAFPLAIFKFNQKFDTQDRT